jgi:hypothetical protein
MYRPRITRPQLRNLNTAALRRTYYNWLTIIREIDSFLKLIAQVSGGRFEDRVPAGTDVRYRGSHEHIRSNADADKITAVGVAVLLCANARSRHRVG